MPVTRSPSFITTSVESADEILFTIMSSSKFTVTIDEDEVDVVMELPPENCKTSSPTLVSNVAESSPTTCNKVSEYLAILVPPRVVPSCTNNVLRSVSTVTSPIAPANDVCEAVVPLLNCT